MAHASSPVGDLLQRINRILKKVGRKPDSVRLIGVSKKQSWEKVIRAVQEGLLDIGENYVQEWKSKNKLLQEKNPSLANQINWHFIGHLQSNKVKEIIGQVEYVHTVDSIKLARKISESAQEINRIQKVLLEVNLGEEESKYGFSPQTLSDHLTGLASLSNLSLEGLMGIPPVQDDPEKSRPYFRKLKSLLDECNRSGFLKGPMKELSMGMSQDFETAIEEGATMVRIGTALFGPRE